MVKQDLKTLKDIDLCCISKKCKVPEHKLRQEAIKWIKRHDCYKHPKLECDTCRDFKKFFNITAEDLK